MHGQRDENTVFTVHLTVHQKKEGEKEQWLTKRGGGKKRDKEMGIE